MSPSHSQQPTITSWLSQEAETTMPCWTHTGKHEQRLRKKSGKREDILVPLRLQPGDGLISSKAPQSSLHHTTEEGLHFFFFLKKFFIVLNVISKKTQKTKNKQQNPPKLQNLDKKKSLGVKSKLISETWTCSDAQQNRWPPGLLQFAAASAP